MKTHIDNTIEKTAMNIVHQIGDALDNKLKDGMDIVSARQITNDVCIDFVIRMIQAQSKRYADDRVKEFASWCDLDQEVIFNHPHFIQDYAEQFINQNTESENERALKTGILHDRGCEIGIDPFATCTCGTESEEGEVK